MKQKLKPCNHIANEPECAKGNFVCGLCGKLIPHFGQSVEWFKGYDKANQEWREKIQKRIDEIEGTSLMSQKDFWHKRTAVDNLEELLSDQPVTDKSLDADGWISVEEKLPDEEIEFLGWDGYYESVMYLSEGCFYYRNDYEAKPTHWRILPEPPKQQKP